MATYLEKDVPDWIKSHLQVDARSQSWAIGGLSNGGTCAMQVLARKGGPYRIALDMSGELHPDLGGIEKTIDKGFAGSAEEFAANDPLSIFATRKDFQGYAASCTIGEDELQDFINQLWDVCQAAQDSGMEVRKREVPGKHEWRVWGPALADDIPWVAAKSHLIDN